MKTLPCATRSRSQAALAIIAAVLAALASATAVQAAPSDASANEGNSTQRRPAQRDEMSSDQPRRPSPFALFDTDKDGTISSSEIDRAADALRQLDKNGDGKLSGRELRPARPDGPPPGEGEDGQSGAPREGNRPRPPRPGAE
jgi:hypothetical protein